MAVNLHLKYPKTLAAAFSRPSFLTGKVCDDYDFIGVKTIRVSSIVTQALNDYDHNRNASSNRYGTPTELTDTYQELSLTQDKSFAITIDKGNNLQQDLMKNSGKVLQLQLREQVVPTSDKYALARFVKYAGTIKPQTDELTSANIVDAILDGLSALDDAFVPDEGRMIWLTSKYHKAVRMSHEFLAADDLSEKAIGRGIIGGIGGTPVTKLPAAYLPAGCYFLITYKDSVMFPKQLSEAKVHEDPPGISGALLEGRTIYDAFVIGQKNQGVYACVASTSVQTTPAVTKGTGNTFSISNTGDTTLYTIDGTDPRYSPTALPYTSGSVTVTGLTAGTSVTVKAVAFSNTNFTSALGPLTFTIA